MNNLEDLNNQISELKKQIDNLIKTDLHRQVHHLIKINLQTCMLHQKTFSKYRGAFLDRNVFLIATGPTLNDFHYSRKGDIYVGVNAAFLRNDIDLDYLFAHDYTAVKSYIDDMDKYRPDTCIKFYGQCHCGPSACMNIPEYHALKAKALRYMVDASYYENTVIFTNDISTQPMPAIPISFAALQFILWGCPKRIYLVGCDCSDSGHFVDRQTKGVCSDQLQAWKTFKDFQQKFYPDTEVISVNPIGLKGMFRDVYTKDYLETHSKINVKEVEILEDL